MRKYYYLLGVLFVSILAPLQAARATEFSDILNEAGIGAVIPAPSQAQRVNQDYSYYAERNMKASNLASDAMYGCYGNKNLEECDKLIKIKNVVIDWCGQGDGLACITYSNIGAQERITSNLYSN